MYIVAILQTSKPKPSSTKNSIMKFSLLSLVTLIASCAVAIPINSSSESYILHLSDAAAVPEFQTWFNAAACPTSKKNLQKRSACADSIRKLFTTKSAGAPALSLPVLLLVLVDEKDGRSKNKKLLEEVKRQPGVVAVTKKSESESDYKWDISA